MTRKPSEAKLMSHSERQVSLTHYRAESSRWDQPATGQEQEGARGINFLLDRLPHPARTPMPAALRSSPLGLSHPAKGAHRRRGHRHPVGLAGGGRAAMSAALKKTRAAVCKRAAGACESCGQWVGLGGEDGHLDHMQGRARAESVETCWLLCVPCDVERTVNEPSATHWLLKMERHALRYGFDPEPYRARMQSLAAKGLVAA